MSSKAGDYLDTAMGRAESAMRLRRILLYDAYFDGNQYSDTREWRNLMGYGPDVTPPALIINYPRLVAERPAHFAFDRARGVETMSEQLQDFVSDASDANSLMQLLPELSVESSVKGDALLLFEFVPKNAGNPFPVRLLPAEDYTLETDPLDAGDINFIRISYRYVDSGGHEVWHRRELHPDRLLVYSGDAKKGRPIWLSGSAAAFGLETGGEPKEWRLVSVEKNPFGFIPAVVVRNRPRTGKAYGESDFADLLTIFDDINWKFSQRSRNISRTMNAILKSVNGRILNDTISENSILSVIGENAQVDYLVNDADMREVATHIADLRRALWEVSGVSVLDPEKLAGYGALSGFALSVLYEPLVALAERKRRIAGGAVERLLSMMSRAAWKLGFIETEPSSFRARITYGPMFRESESELFDRQARLLAGLDAGVLTKEYVAQQIEGAQT